MSKHTNSFDKVNQENINSSYTNVNSQNDQHFVSPKRSVKINNKRNGKRFNNCGYSLFFLMGIFLKHLWLIPNILKWLGCKIFTKLVPSQTPSKSSHRRCSMKKVFFENLQKSYWKTSVLESLLNKVTGH